MNNTLLKMYVKMQSLMVNEEGQDLVEYALVLALIAIVAIATLNRLAVGVTAVLSDVAANL